MHELPRLAGSPRRGITVETRKTTSLENFLGGEPTHQCRNRFGLLLAGHPDWKVRKQPSGGYNCAGMAWASRRVCLPNPKDWRQVLNDDGYRRLEGGDTPYAGDLVIYSAESGEIVHVAKICRVDSILNNLGRPVSSEPIVSAISKWDGTSGECVHKIKDIPDLNGIKSAHVTIEIWTDRLQSEGEHTHVAAIVVA